MLFGEWIRSRRKQQGITLVELSEKTGLTHPGISIIENSRSRPTLTSAKRLCEALDVTPADLVWATQERRDLPYLEIEPPSYERDALSVDDLAGLLRLYEDKEDHVKALLVELLNWIMHLYEDEIEPSDEGIPELAVENVEAILADSPLHVSYLRSAPTAADMVLQTYEHGGVLTAQDLAIYLDAAYEQFETKEADGRSLYRMIDSVRRRSSNDLAVQVLLEDILILDRALASKGEVLAMFWRVAELGERLEHTDEKEQQVASLVVTGYRWWQHLIGWKDDSWLEHLRSEIERLK